MLAAKRMVSRRILVLALVLLPRLLAQSAEGSDALERLNARLAEISRSYQEQFAEIRKNERSDKANIRSAKRQIQQLGMMRTKAIAEAQLRYQKEQKQT